MIAEGVQHAPQVTGRTMAPGSAAGARFQTQFVAQRPSIGSAAALKQTKKSLMGEIKRRRAAGMAAPNRKRQRNTGGAVRRAEMRVFGSIVRRSVAGRWPHQHAGLFGYALRQYAGGLVRRAQRPFGLQHRSQKAGAPYNSRGAGEQIKFNDIFRR